MAAFRQRIREKIADDNLQIALDGNVERRLKGRAVAIASLPNWEERRQKAHAIRADVIEHLDEYLAQFIGRVEKNGIIVHRAKDAGEAVELVLQIVKDLPRSPQSHTTGTSSQGETFVPLRGEKVLFAKAKSMVSEEIELNHALEAAGHRVVETDLGEYIVQLRHEKPAHLITPAVHLRRSQVGQLFHEKLGIPYTEDIPTLTNTARKILREVFLTADVGVSGVNFGVAETGTLTLVTNEGNGRMCTTLPPVHIALMGMERLLPTLDDLALFLSLLPRSATGQKLSVYTQLMHRPENGQQKHLVLVDNGRSALRASPLKESLSCIRCGACLNACPVFREVGGHAYLGRDSLLAPYPGPIGSVVSPGLLGENFAQLAQASSLCGACKDVCPVDIDLPKMLLRVRAGMIPALAGDGPKREGQGIPDLLKLALGAFARFASHPRLYALGQRLLGWVSAPLPAFLPAPAATGWGYSKDFPKPAAKPFRARWEGGQGERKQVESRQVESRQVEMTVADPGLPVSLSTSSLSPSLPERFTTELTAVGGHVHSVRAEDLPRVLIAFLSERGIDGIQAWETVPGVTAADLTAAGILVEKSSAPELRAGLTGALAGIAETGSLVIPGGAGQPLTASLVHEIHLAVLRAADILPSLEQAIRLPGVVSAPATVLVTGPSRTADIEMTLTIGVHGPKELHVFII
jgi:L-lactate dehydrogenase complex protein LldF